MIKAFAISIVINMFLVYGYIRFVMPLVNEATNGLIEIFKVK